MSGTYEFRLPNVLVFGSGAADKIAEYVTALEAKKPLIVTDKGICGSGIIERIQGKLDAAGTSYDLWSDVEAEPSLENAEEGFKRMQESGCDLVIGIGGGSSMDVGKAISLLSGNPGSLRDYFGVGLVKSKGVPMIMLPTTAGTGAEVTWNAVFNDKSVNLKKAISSANILPDVALVDPELTYSCPPKITAATGMDALTHAIESYTATRSNAHTDLYALEGVRLIGRSLRTAVRAGSDVVARETMARGSLFSGISLANAGVAAVHALAYPLGAVFHVSHGMSNASLLPYVMWHNRLAAAEKYAKVAEALGEDISGLSVDKASEKAVNAVRALSEEIGIPQSLGEFGVKNTDCREMAPGAVSAQRLMTNNPCSINEEEAANIYEHALSASLW